MIIEQQIESDLRSLATESRKKHAPIREAAERALTTLRQQPSSKASAIFEALGLVKASGNPKLVTLGLNLLHKLVLSSPADSLLVLDYLTAAAEQGDESLQLKTLQTLMLLLNPSTVELSPPFAEQAFSICLALFKSKVATIKNTASASVRHLVSLTFDKLQPSKTYPTTAVLQSGLRLFQLIVELAGAKDAALRHEGVELIILAVAEGHGWIRELQQLNLVFEHVTGGLLPALIQEVAEPVLSQKAIQCAEEIMEQSDLGFPILQQLFAIVELQSSPEWQKISILERFSQLCSSPITCQRLYRYQQGALFTGLVDCLSKVCSQCLQSSDKRKIRLVDEVIRLVSEAVTHLVESLMSMVERAGVQLGEPVKIIPVKEDQETVEGLVNLMWRPLLPILSGILGSSLNETVLQTVLNCFQSVINISGTLEIAEAREGFLSALAHFCVPPAEEHLSPQQIHACKTLFNIAHCLGSILDVKTWHKLLDTLHMLEHSFALTRAKPEDSEMTSDIQILSSALDTLFSNSVLLNDVTLLNLLSALGQLTLEYMETLATAEKKSKDTNTFGLDKMLIVASKNLSRSTLYWDIVSPHLDCICNSKYPEMRDLGVTSLTKLLIDVFKYMSENPPTERTDKWLHWQQTIFLCLHDLAGSSYEDTQQAVFQAIFEVLQTCGGQLNRTGWGMLLLILSRVRMESQGAVGFKCLSLIVSDFLLSEQLAPSLKRVVECTSKFAHDTTDITAAVSAVGMFWNISDALASLGKDEEDLWWMIIENLKTLGKDSRVEVRNTSTNTLHVLLSTHGGCLSSDTWQKIMKNIIFDLLETLAEPPTKPERKSLPLSSESIYKGDKIIVHHSRDSVEKQWEETYNIYIQNIGKLLSIYLAHTSFNSSSPSADVLETWSTLLAHLKRSIQQGSDLMIQSVLKSVKEMLSSELVKELFFLHWDSAWELFKLLTERIKDFAPSHKLVNIVLEDLDLIFGLKQEAALKPEPCEELLTLLECVLNALKMEAGLSCKLMPEEREVFEVVEQLPAYFQDSNECMQLILTFIISQVSFVASDPHSEAYCRRGFKLIEEMSARNPILMANNVNSLLSRYRATINLRFENEAIVVLTASSKGSKPLWCVAGESLLRGLQVLTGFEAVWVEMVATLENVLTPPESTLTQLSRSNLEEAVKSGEPLDIMICTFIQSTLIPLSVDRDPDFQIRLLTLLDTGCNNYYRSFHDSSLQGSLSTACLGFLFDLAKVVDVEDSLALRVSKRATPILMGRCKDFLRRFINEEKQSGMMPLPKARLVELVEILQCLKDLDIPEGTLERPGKKAHLLELFPQLCELITSRENEVKELLKEMFLEVARAIDSPR